MASRLTMFHDLDQRVSAPGPAVSFKGSADGGRRCDGPPCASRSPLPVNSVAGLVLDGPSWRCPRRPPALAMNTASNCPTMIMPARESRRGPAGPRKYADQDRHQDRQQRRADQLLPAAAEVQISTTPPDNWASCCRPRSPCRGNWMRHSLTIRNAARPTARISIELNRERHHPRRFKAADEHPGVGDREVARLGPRTGSAPIVPTFDSLPTANDRDEAGEEAHGGDHRRADGDPLGSRALVVLPTASRSARIWRARGVVLLAPSRPCRSPSRRSRSRCRPPGPKTSHADRVAGPA